ncbi:hypothetical protein CBS101457_002146 [Exobasidium rhododendri]|nr:hypothetical protein CBS101457_002146 [Exobasidium rhododendri]
MTEYETKIFIDERARLRTEKKNEHDTDSGLEEYMEKSFYIVGVDEVGVGPLAGPIVSCAIAFKFPFSQKTLRLLNGINDSKKLSAAKRQALVEVIEAEGVKNKLGIVPSDLVDQINPRQGSIEAMRIAVTDLISELPSNSTVHVLVDHHRIGSLPSAVRQTSITKGDSKSVCIAAASIIAKVWRDDYMLKLHAQYPHFGFDRNAGYGTPIHLAQLKKGLTCPEHRFSFEPVRQAQRKASGLPPDEPTLRKRVAATPTTAKSTKTLQDPNSAADVKLVDEPATSYEPLTETKAAPSRSSVLSLSYWTNLLLPTTQSTT